MAGMARVKVVRRMSFATLFALWDIWRRLPPSQRRWLTQKARMHGPRLAKQALDSRSRRPKR